MKKLINKLAVWLYKITRDESIKSPIAIFQGCRIIQSEYLEKGKIIIGKGDNLMASFIDKEIRFK